MYFCVFVIFRRMMSARLAATGASWGRAALTNLALLGFVIPTGHSSTRQTSVASTSTDRSAMMTSSACPELAWMDHHGFAAVLQYLFMRLLPTDTVLLYSIYICGLWFIALIRSF